MAIHYVTKTHFLQNFISLFIVFIYLFIYLLYLFSGRRQIDAAEGTESFASIPAAVFELSIKSGKGQNSPRPPPPQRGAC